MNIIGYKPFQTLKNWPYVTGWTLELYHRVRHEGEVADRCLASFLRRNRQIGSRNRRSLGDLLFNTLRWDLAADAYAELVLPTEECTDSFRIAAGLILATAPEAPEPEVLAQHLELSDAAQQALASLHLHRSKATEPIWTTGLSPYLSDEFTKVLGEDGFHRLADALLKTGPVWLRAREPLQTQRLVMSLRESGLPCALVPELPGALRLEKRGPLQNTQAYREGRVWVQDLGSQLIGRLVAPAADHRVLDACAGAGGKSLCLLSDHPNLDLTAWDVDRKRLQRLQTRLKRSRLGPISTQVIEPEGPLPETAGRFDRVLIDAPCSGSGTLAGHPEGRRRIIADQVSDYARRQRAILRRFADLVRPGGRLIYATCSMLSAENEEQVASFLEDDDRFHLVNGSEVLGEELATALDQGTYLRLWPHRHACDGFFGAVLERS